MEEFQGLRHRLPVRGERVVPLALPALGRPGQRSMLTLTVPRKMYVPKKLAQAGLAGYETTALACFLAALDVAGPGAALDIGANIGVYAALASALSDRDVRAFEPMPTLAAEARRFAGDNRLGYQTESIALGTANGRATFYLSDVTDSSNSLAAGFRKSSKQIPVEVETLDSYMTRTGLAPAVIKVDTETTEPDVLAGGVETIMKHRPWILCEVLAGRGEDRLAEVVTPFGYHWYHISGEVPYPERQQIVGDGTYKHLMWLFAPDRPGEEFWSRVRQSAAALAECTPERGAQQLAQQLAARPRHWWQSR